MENKVIYGVKNVHIASVTLATAPETGVVTATFGTPQALPGVVSISMEQEGDTSTFYADNTAYWVGVANNGYSGSLEVAVIPDWFYLNYLGMKSDSDGNIIETANDQSKYFALQFEFDGDKKAKRYTFYYVKATRPADEGETTEDTIEPATQTIDLTAIPLPVSEPEGIIKAISTTESKNYDTWYTSIATPQLQV